MTGKRQLLTRPTRSIIVKGSFQRSTTRDNIILPCRIKLRQVRLISNRPNFFCAKLLQGKSEIGPLKLNNNRLIIVPVQLPSPNNEVVSSEKSLLCKLTKPRF